MAAIYQTETYEPKKSIGYLIHRVKAELMAALDEELARDPAVSGLEVTAAQYVILTNLASGEVDSAARFCKVMSYDPGAMTRMVDRLEAKGLVQRKRCPNDRRLVNIELTDEGHAAVPKLRACSVTVLNRFLRGFTQDDATTLTRLLTRMAENA